MSLRKSIRLLLWLSVAFGLGLLCLLVTSRWWLPPVLPRVAELWAVELASAERIEGGGLRLSGLALELGETSISIDRVELPSEWRYLRERFSGEWSAASTLRIGRVAIVAGEAAAPAAPASGEVFLPEIREQILQGLAAADPWLPGLELEGIEYRDGSEVVALVEALDYQDRRLTGRVAAPALPGHWQLAAELPAEGPWRLDFSQAEWDLSGALQLEGDGQQAAVEARLERGGSEARLTARFSSSAWLPEEARLSSGGFDLSGLRLPLAEDISLALLGLEAFEAEWDGEAYRFKGAGRSLVQAPEVADQALAFALSGRGNLEALRLDTVRLEGDWAKVTLSEPLAVDFRRRSFAGEARLRAEVDLGEQPWFEAAGQIEAELRADAASPETLHFDLQGRELAYENFAAQAVEAEGRLGFEALHLDALSLTPSGAEVGEQVQLAGTVDWQAMSLNFEYKARLGAEWVNRMIGQEVLVAPLELEAGEVTGPWGSPELRGAVRTTLQTGAIEPVDLSAQLQWDGRSRLAWQGELGGNEAAIAAEGSFGIEAAAWSLELASLRWSDPERPELTLAAPAELRWQRSGNSWEDSLSVSAFTLRGDDLEASVSYAPAEGLSLLLKNVSLARLNRWVPTELPVYHVELIAAELTDFRPFLAGRIEIAVEEQVDATAQARLELSADLAEDTVAVRELALRFSGEEVLQGTFDLPLRLRLPLPPADAAATKQSFYALGDGALRGRLAGHASPAFSRWLQARTGLRIGETTVDMEIAGDLREPVGHIHLQAAEVEIGPGMVEAALPTIDALDLRVQVDEKSIDVQALDFSLNRSAVRAAFKLPLEVLVDQAGAEAFEPMPLLRAASGEIELDAWKMENWLDWLPPYFRRTGQFSASLSLAPELQLSGQLDFEDFGLRPTATLASVDQIAGQIRMEDRLLKIDEAGARFGGSRVEFAGEMDVTDLAQPLWFFDVKGDKLPILRTTEMLLRSDLDIRVDARDPEQTPLVAGEMNLRSSTLLVDFDPLAPRLQKGGTARPPFFSITEEPFAAWRFDLRIVGDRFMRVRSPYFRSQLSADFELTGTFADPLLLGSVRTLDAELNFPGAKFVINDGEALIEASRPNEMQLAFNGIAQKSSKVIAMEVSQTLDDPAIQFESTPAMSQADIVRLLATGSTTGGGVGNLGLYLGQGMLGAGGMNNSLADKLSVDVGEETSRSGRKTIDASYEITPRWSVEGGYDVFDAYNADLIWTIFKR